MIVKIFTKSQKTEVLYQNENSNSFQFSASDREKILKRRLGEKIYLLFNNLLARVVYTTEEFTIATIERIPVDESQDQVLTRNVLHNINNLLTSINNNSYLLNKSPAGSEIRDLVENVYDSSRIAIGISRSYLKYSISRIVAEPVKFDLRELVEDCINIVFYRLQQKGISIDFDADEKLPYYTGRKGFIQQALLSIILNAIDAFEEINFERQKRITVKLTFENEKFFIEISDNGCGIKKSNLDKIFTEGFTTKERGSGLGLSLARSIIEANNGKIDLTSFENEGTTALIELNAKVSFFQGL